MYASPATAEMGQVMYAAPWAGAEEVTYLAPVAAEAEQVMIAAGAEVGQASCVTAPTALEEGQEVAPDALGAAAEGGQIASLAPTLVEGSPVPTSCAPVEPLAYMEAAAGQQMYAAPVAARVNVSHEIFAKLAAGLQLTPEEMISLSGQPAADEHPAANPSALEHPVGLEESAETAAAVESEMAVVTEVAAADTAAAITSTEAKTHDPKESDSKK